VFDGDTTAEPRSVLGDVFIGPALAGWRGGEEEIDRPAATNEKVGTRR
jgi:hypothetical protein